MKADLLCVWPDTIDFPLFRKWVHEERQHFSKVIIVFTQTNWPFTNLEDWIKEQMKHDDISFVQNDPVGDNDWRDVAVKKGLTISDNEWVFFTEPDFFPNKNLWEELESFEKDGLYVPDVFAVMQGERLHPCGLFIKRAVLDMTSKNFSASPPDYDHFGQIQKDLEGIVFSVINPKFYYHMNGLSHNMFLLQSDKEPVYKPEEFKDYLQKCLQLDLPLHKEFIKLAKEYLEC